LLFIWVLILRTTMIKSLKPYMRRAWFAATALTFAIFCFTISVYAGNTVSEFEKIEGSFHRRNSSPASAFDLALDMRLSSAYNGILLKTGDIIQFTINLYNQGTQDATDVEITNYVPAGLSLNDSGWDLVSSDKAKRIIPLVSAGGLQTFTIQFLITQDFQGYITNAAEISGTPNGNDIDSEADDINGNQAGEILPQMKDNVISENGSKGGDEDDHDYARIFVYKGGKICWVSPSNPVGVNAITEWWYIDSVNNTVTIRATFSKGFVDNTYGTNAVGWPNGQSFDKLVGSDRIRMSLINGGGSKSLEFELDYIDEDPSAPSGYSSLGIWGGEGKMLSGSSSFVLNALSSLDVNLNTYGYNLTVNSPQTDNQYTPNPTYPNWIYDVWYEVTVSLDAFGASGFGQPLITYIHASPSKTGNNTEVVEPGPCPGECPLPIALFDEDACLGVGTVFIGQQVGANYDYIWDFGPDAIPSNASGAGPHLVTFQSTGQKSVKVTVENNCEPPVVTGDCCEAGDKPQILIMKYTGHPCDSTSHKQDPSKVSCSGNPNYDPNVYIIANNNSNPNSGDKWFSGNVQLTGFFSINAKNANKTRLSSETFIHIYNQQGGTLLQTIRFHTSCSQVLAVGDRFGATQVMEFLGEEGYSCGGSNPDCEICEKTIYLTIQVDSTLVCPDDLEVNCEESTHPLQTGYPEVICAADSICFDYIDSLVTQSNCEIDLIRKWQVKLMSSPNLPEVIPTGDCCPDLGRPAELTLIYTGEDCSATKHTQDPGKVSCSGNPAFNPLVYVIANDNSSPSGGKKWFQGYVSLNQAFTLLASNGGSSELSSNTYIHVLSGQGGSTLQTILFHTSCSQPLGAGDQFGSMLVSDFSNKNGESCSNSGSLFDCCESGGKPKKLTMKYTGADCSVTSHNQDPSKVSCSGDPAEDIQVYIIANDNSSPGSGKKWFQGTVDLNDTWVIDATNAGQTRLSSETFVHIYSQQGGTKLQTLRFHTSCSQPLGIGDQFGSMEVTGMEKEDGSVCGAVPGGTEDCCADGGKVAGMIFRYTGSSCSATSHQQDAGKVTCNGNPNNDPAVYIVINDNSNPASGNIWYAGDVNLNEHFAAYASNAGQSQFANETFIHIFASQGGTKLQTVKFHTSCSQPLGPGNVFGALDVITVNNTNGSSCGQQAGDLECFKVDPPVNGSKQNVNYTFNYNSSGDPVSVNVTGQDIVSVAVKGSGSGVSKLYETGPFTGLTAPMNPITGSTYPIQNLLICAGLILEEPEIFVDCCEQGGRPQKLVLTYTGEDCSATMHNQDPSKVSCNGNPNFDNQVYIIANDNSNPSSGKKWFQGQVNLNANFTVNSLNAGESDLSSETFIHIYNQQGGTIIQTVRFHTSCSQPLRLNDQFGSVGVVSIVDKDGNTCDGESSSNPDCCDLDEKPSRLIFEYTGESCSATSHNQDPSKVSCNGNPNFSPTVLIIANDNSNPASGNIWFSGQVGLNETFTINSANKGLTKLSTETFVHIYNAAGTVLLQSLRFHTSCSQPLSAGNQFGSIVLMSFVGEDGGACGEPANGGLCFPAKLGVSGSKGSISYAYQLNGNNEPVSVTVTGSGIASVEVTGNFGTLIYEHSPFVNLIPPADPTTGEPGVILNVEICKENPNSFYTIVECEQRISLIDEEPPVILCPADTIVVCTLTDLVLGEAYAEDACSAIDTVYYTDGPVLGPCPARSFIRTWIAEDVCGNQATCEQSIGLLDTLPPLITCPNDITVQCDQSILPVFTGNPIYSDSCSMVEITYVDVITPGNCLDSYVITRTWTAEDECGNMATCVQLIAVVDTQAPVITCPADKTIECSDSQLPDLMGFATSTDNCDPNPTETYTDLTIPGNCPETFTIRRTWLSSDRCGNVSTTCTHIITVRDTTNPTWDQPMPANITVECSAVPAPPTPITASDNCDNEVAVSYAQVRTDGNCLDNYTLTRTWVATDNCGNALTHTQIITVRDTTNPTWDQPMPANITVECSAVPAPASPITASDNCDNEVAVSYAQVRTDGNCLDNYTLTRTWVATDNCGNALTHTQIITVRDTTNPTWDQPMPANITVECSAVPAPASPITASDNCDNEVAVSYAQVRTDGNCLDNYTLTRTWVATDNCGNALTHTQIITVRDTTNPTWDQPMPANITVECSAVPAPPTPITASDNCDNEVAVSYAQVRTDGNCLDNYTLTRTWVATDNCGNALTHTQIITVRDTTNPTWDQPMPANITVECSAVPAPPTPITASDNCDNEVAVSYAQVRTDGNCLDNYTLTRTWVATDNCGNALTHTQIITVRDTTNPNWDQPMPANITVECSAVPAPPTPITASDNCDNEVAVSYAQVRTDGNCLDNYTLTRTWVATDNCGNALTHTQIITVRDTTNPTWDQPMPANITVECSAVPAPASPITASDNCDNEVAVSYTQVRTDGNCLDNYTLTRTWVATDNCGNALTHTQIITVRDTTDPTWDQPMPANITVECSAVPAPPTPITASDNCDNEVAVSYTQVRTDGNCLDNYTLTRTWVATDNCGNAFTHTQIITVRDTINPTWDQPMPANITVECSAVPAPPTPITASDNCDNEVAVSYAQVRTDGNCLDNYTLTRTWVATDNCGNALTHTQIITVRDTTNPSWDQPMPPNITVECSAVPAPPTPITASDNCDNEVAVSYAQVRTDGNCLDNYTLTRTWVATDNCGNAFMHTQIITVRDTANPIWDQPMPANITVECSAVPAPPTPITASDNCDNEVAVSYAQVRTDGNCLDNYTLTRTWVATDNCGNALTHTQIITVRDTANPIWDQPMPANITVECSAVPAPPTPITASDNCDNEVAVSYAQVRTDGNCLDNYTLTRTWVATDNCGNALTHTQIITVRDTANPIWDQPMPANITVECSAVPAPPTPITASDNCDNEVAVSYAQVRTDGNCLDNYTLTRTWVATDNCGNALTHTQIITVRDTTNPTWDQPMPANITVECNAVPAPPTPITASDNCDNEVAVSYAQVRTDGNCLDNYTLTRTWVATDNCGNALTHTQIITVRDTTNPTWDQPMPANITVECSAVPAPPTPITASDNCDNEVAVSYAQVRTDGNCLDNYTLTRTWVATDNCGNALTHTQIITVRDTTNPSWDQPMPANITVECSAVPAPPTPITASDNCDNEVAVSYAQVRTDGNCLDNYTLTRTWVATDNCGNALTHTQIITVRDTTNPTWDQPMPANITVECSAVPAPPTPITASDNCDNEVAVSYAQVRTDGNCLDNYTLTRTWVATDNCGNALTHTQIITVRDTTNPTWDQPMPANITVECNAVPAPPTPITASDNCDNEVAVSYAQVRTDGNCLDNYTLTRTWVATDNCGNALTHTQIITVWDTTNPTWDQPMPANITVECSAVPAPPTPITASDNCDNEVAVSYAQVRTDGNCLDNYTLTRTWVATDNCGNALTHTQIITVRDTTNPSWDQPMPANITVECSAVPAPPTPITASDNCDNEVAVSYAQVRTDGNCLDNYTLTRTWVATDNCGNALTHTQIITVRDTTNPTWDQPMPANITVECSAVPAPPTPITASDNCDNEVTVSYAQVRTDGNCLDNYILTRTWVATDNCGNALTHTQIITVRDTTNPTWDQPMPANITVECDAVPTPASPITASDNCDNDVNVTFTEVRTDGNCPDNYTLTRTWVAIDNCNNAITHVQVVTVEDTTAPTWDQPMPANITVECDAVPSVPTPVTASDNCDNNVNITFTEVRTDGNCPDNYTLTRTWVAIDNCNNATTHLQVLTVQDTTDPTWDQPMPSNITVECDAVPSVPTPITASDNCDINVNVTFTEVRTDGNCPDNYTLTRTWVAIDNCNNATTHVQVVTVEDTAAPTWDQPMPSNITVECDAAPSVPTPITASDNCDINVNVTFTEVRTDGNCPDNYTLTRTWVAIDNCNNATTHVQVLKVEDTTAPTWDQPMPANITVECDAVPTPASPITASDNCDNDVNVTFTEVRTDGNCPDNYTLTRTWVAIDNCNNATTHVQVVTVEDTTAPTWDQPMPANITVECDAVPSVPTPITASDNCDNNVNVTFTEVRTDGNCPDNYTLTRTWVAIDNCNNATSHVQVVKVEDTTAPTWDQPMPSNITVECDAVPSVPTPITASDNCDINVNVTFTEVRTDGNCPDNYTLTRTWVAIDNCNNATTHVQVVTVEDTTAPTWDQPMPSNITVECDAVPSVPTPITASDNCDIDVNVTFTEVRTDGNCPDNYTLTRTWVAMDNCNNATTHLQVLTVQDTTDPTWDQPMPSNITVECDAIPSVPTPITASDNCDINVNVTFTEVRTDGNCPDNYTLTRTWVAIDNCNNATTHLQVLTVQDTTDPTWDQPMPSNITVECDAVPSAPTPITASDNCDINVNVTFTEVRTDGNCPDNYTLTRTWVAIDNCNNATTHVQVVKVEDTTAPTWDQPMPANITVECDAVPSAPTPITASDNCDINVNVTFTEVRTDGNCPDNYTLTRTWVAIDNCNNAATHVQVVTVEDTTAPTWDQPMPSNITVECDAVPSVPTPITASDNCDNNVNVTFTEVRTDGNCPDNYTLTRTWVAIDNCNNAITHVQVVTVEDTTAPTWDQPMPSNITVECDAVPTVPTPITASDNCDINVNITFTEVRTDGNCPDNYTLTRTWVAIDNCNNATTHVQVVKVEDTTAPTWDQPMPSNITVECDAVPSVPTPITASDNCDNNVNVTFTEVRTDGNCPDNYTLTRTWIAIDNCNNAITHIQVVTVEDTTVPTWDQPMPVNITVECDAVPSVPTPITASDNCDNNVNVTFTEVRTDGNCPDNYTLTRTWVAIDNCNNAITHVQVVTVEDTTAPTWDQPMPSNITVECDAVPSVPTPITASDNCDNNVNVTFTEVRTDGNCPDNYTLTRTWVAIDNCNNAITHVQVVTVEDTTAPTWDQPMPSNITVECDAVPTVPTPITASDNCDINVNITFTEVRTDGNCPDNYTLTRTWVAIDNCNNATSHVQVVKVEDTTAPTWDQPMPSNITVECDAVPSVPTPITASDNCDNNVNVTFTEVRTDGNCPDNYTLTRTWVAIDNCNNATTHVQVVTVEDTTAPTWDQPMPSNITVECDAVPTVPTPITASDNCDINVNITFTEVRTDGNCPDNYTLTRTWVAIDNCNNATTHVQVVTVEDTTAPTWDQPMPANITVECDAVPSVPTPITASDNCDINVNVTFTEVRTDGNCPDNYTLTRTWVAIDNCNNAATHVQVVTVEDTTAPTWDQPMPSNITVECDAVPSVPTPITASDNCDNDVNITFTEVRTDGNCPDNYTLTRTWVAIDNCNNAATHVQVVTVEDTTVPIWDQPMPSNITVECDAVPSVPTPITASDNCDNNVNITFTEVRTDGNCPDNYTLTRTWVAIDNCNNAITHAQVVTVEDTTAPTWDQPMPSNITVECDAVPSVPTPITASDNCDNNVNVTFTEVRTDGSCPDNYTLTRSWVAIDNCNNATTHVQVVTVGDTTSPTWDQPMPSNITVECDAVPSVPTPITASDNCDNNVNVTFTEVRTDGSCPDNYTLTRSWVAIDNCNNATTHVQVVTVEDTTSPTWDQPMPSNITVECDAVPSVPTPITASDNCDNNVNVTFTEVRTDGSCPDNYTLTRTWVAIDNCNNATTHVQVVTVEDTTAPTWDQPMPSNITVECDAVPSVPTPITASDNCDNSVNVTFTEVRTDGNCPDNYTLTRSWVAIDNCNNATTHVQVVTVEDTTSPTWDQPMPSNITVECDAVPSVPTPITASDNCDNSVNVTFTEVRTDGNCPDNYTLTRSWVAIDNCNNATTHVQVVTVEDTTSPTWDQPMPSNITVECDAVPSVPTPITASDNCDNSVNVSFTEVRTDGSCPDNYTLTRSWVAIDNCNNATTHVQVVTVEDTTSPTWDQPMPSNITVECDAVPSVPTPITASDNCDNNVNVTFTEVRTDGSCPDNYTLTRSWVAIDNCNNATTYAQVVTVLDTSPPEFDQVPEDITVECDDITDAPIVTASDNCDLNVEITFVENITNGNCANSATITRTWVAIDNCGNATTVVQLVTIEDTTPPTFDNPPSNITVECDAVPNPPIVTASDNCDSNVSINFSQTRVDGTCPDSYTLIRTWIATDNCGNSAVHTQSVSVRDSTDPVFDQLPGDLTVECNNVPLAPTITASDNCDLNVAITFAEVRTDGSCPDNYTLTRTWVAIDNCNNAATHIQKVFVQDSTDPVFNQLPANITVECDNVPFAPTVTATDNCDNDVNVTFTEVRTNGTCPDAYTLTRTWVAIDNCGNNTSLVQIVTVEDTTPPVFNTHPDNLTIECDEAPPVYTPEATDNCDADVLITLAETIIPGNCLNGFTVQRVFTARDNCGNSAQQTQLITFEDTQAPILIGVPQDLSIECGVDEVPEIPVVTATDNCDNNVTIIFSEVVLEGSCEGNLTVIRTWTATDNCNNTASAQQFIYLGDSSEPILENTPQNVTVECDNVPPPATVTAIDLCDDDVEVTFTQIKIDGSCPDSYLLERTWTAVDECGNSAVHTQTVSVRDTQNPVLSATPADITVQCDAVGIPMTISATDNCDQNVVVTFSETSTPGFCEGNYTLTRTWVAVDNCGNAASHAQKVFVEDTTPPQFEQSLIDITVNCNEVPEIPQISATDNCSDVEVFFNEAFLPGNCIGNYTLTRTWIATDDCDNTAELVQQITVVNSSEPSFTNVPNNVTVECDNIPSVINPTASNDCGSLVTLSFAEIRIDGNCPDSYQLVRTWTADDDCGNTAQVSQVITVVDTTPPVLSSNPVDITVECDQIPSPAVLTGSDNCDINVTVTFSQVTTPGLCIDQNTITRTWVAIDNCNNATTHVQLISVRDTEAPLLVGVPTDVTAECDGINIPPVADVVAIDNCDTNVEVVFSETRVDGSCPDNYTLTRLWTATDNCGNSATGVQVISVGDTTPPEFTSTPQNVTVECDNVPDPATVTATDNCDPNVTVTYNQVITPGACPENYTITRTWVAIDNCGNAASHAQTIVVEDTEAPVLVGVPEDVIAECTGGSVPPVATVTATDNCDTNVEVVFSETRVDGSCPDNYTLTRMWTATDNCGNSASGVQVISVGDTTPPEFTSTPQNVTVECDNVPDPATVIAIDNCDPNVTVTYNQVITPGACPENYTITRNWVAIDNCGNAASHAQTIVVEDTEAPVLVGVPEDVIAECTGGSVPPVATVTATDNCDTNVEVVFSETRVDGSCPDNYTLTRLWTATDNCGNSATGVQVISVGDTTPPEFTSTPQNVTIECDNVPDPATVIAIDNCDPNVTVTYNQVITPGACPENYTITRTWVAIDNCGNAASHAQTIVVEDTEAPVLVGVPEDVIAECTGGSVPPVATVTATDNCDTNVEVVFSETRVDGSCPDNYTLTRLWTATDNCGNSATGVQVISVGDTTPPEFTSTPQNVTVECDNVPDPATVTADRQLRSECIGDIQPGDHTGSMS
jgi:large repetitive protein